MAGSLNHIISKDGTFTMDYLDHLGDAHEALSECFHIILRMSGGDMSKVSDACRSLGYPDPFTNRHGDNAAAPMRSTPETW